MTFIHVHVSTGLYLPISWLITAWVEVLEVYYAAYFSNIFSNWICTCIYATTSSLNNRNVKFASVCEWAVPCTAATPLLWTIYEHKTLSECVCVLNVKNMSRLIVYTQSPPLHTQQYTVCKYVCWSYNRVSGSSWYLHLKVNLNQFPCPVGDARLNDFWLIQRVSTLFNLPSGAWI